MATPTPNASDFFAISLHDAGAIEFGAIDNRSMSAPARDTIYSCNASAMGDSLSRPWVGPDGTIYFADKPVIEGSVEWSNELSVSVSTIGERTISGNGLPDHATGEYPVARDSEAFSYDRNPNSIAEQEIEYVVPSKPQLADEPQCLPMGTIGVALSGGVFFNALDADLRDAVANEIFDACEGHPQANGAYHYHHNSPCFETGEEGEHSPLIGYSLDGFGIYGPNDVNGEAITNDELDECHGHTGPVPTDDDGIVEVYHYHVNGEFPYTLGCFMGDTVVQAQAPQGGGLPPRVRR